MKYSRILSTGSYLPPRRLTNADLTAELAAKAWTLFQDIEAKGGIIAALSSAALQDDTIYLRKLAVSSTMGVGVRVDTQTIAG
mgnify:CR=1 FL=1